VKRREFLASLAAASVLPSARAGAQQKVKVHRLAGVVPTDPVSVLSETGPVPPERAFFERLRQLGFVDGQNLKVMRFSARAETAGITNGNTDGAAVDGCSGGPPDGSAQVASNSQRRHRADPPPAGLLGAGCSAVLPTGREQLLSGPGLSPNR
jgi:hypothetical protein